MFLGLETLDTLELLALVRHFPCAAFILHDIEGVAGLRGSVEAEHQYGRGGRCGRYLLAPFVEHGLYLAGIDARYHRVAYVQCAVLYEQGGYVAASLVECRFDDRTGGFPVGIGFEFK